MLWRRMVALASPTDDPDEAMAKTRKSARFVAIVDDDAGVRAGLESLLNSVGLKTRTFASAEAYLRLKDSAAVLCLILDMRLPGMSGLELQRRLRAEGQGIPTIFITADDDADGGLRARMEEAGAVAVLRKPCNAEELTRLVRTAVETRLLCRGDLDRKSRKEDNR
jgi:FixJ family two-component response regulator